MNSRIRNKSLEIFFLCQCPDTEGIYNILFRDWLDYEGVNEVAYDYTKAHELGHGAYRLRQTFSEENRHREEQGKTSNLMDYVPADRAKEAEELKKYQWDLIHDPEVILFARMEEEEEGQIFDYSFIPKGYREWLIETINLLIKNSKLFLKVYNQVKSSEQIFRFGIYSLGDYLYVDPKTNGFFRPAVDLEKSSSYIDIALNWLFGIPLKHDTIKAGDKHNPHWIKFSLNENTYKRYNETSTKNPATVFEEIFHAGQNLYYNNYNTMNELLIETEVKIARGFVLYTSGGLYSSNFEEWVTKDNWGKLIYSWDDKKRDFVYKNILKYFDAIKNKKEITKELENKFRLDVKRFAKEHVFPAYKNRKNWREELLNSYDGSTDYFNSLVK